jgi:sterol-4alpha-carboxylate 3-dehydrogenase (decarboxylating)
MWGAYQKTYDTRMSHIQIGPNTSMYDYTFALNLVDAHLLAADQLGVNPSVAGEIFFISDDAPLPFWDFPRKTCPLLAAADSKPNPPPPKKTLAVPRWLGWWIGLFSEVVCWFLGKEPVLSRYTVMYMCVSRWHSVEKAKRVLGYRPRFTTDEGIERSVKVNSSISPSAF